jgi:signal transduction histidine kinase
MAASNSHSTLAALRHAPHRADRLLAITLELNRMRDPDALLDFIIETAADVLCCEATSILLYDDTTDQLHFAAATGSDAASLAQIPVPLDDSIAGTIFTANEPLIIDDTAQDERHFEGVDDEVAFQTRTLVGVPMRIGEEPVGVLEGLNKTDGAFTEDDVAVLSVLAAQAAIAIRNARQVQALERANAKLSRLDALKSDFLSLASHELRTPLATIKGYGEILEAEGGSDLAPHVDAIVEAAARMEAVVDTMAQMELLRSGADALSVEPVVLQSVVQAAHDETTALAEERRHAVALNMPDAPVRLSADPERLQLVFEQLLTNAFLFTPEGGRVTIRAKQTDAAACVTVRDTGIGVPEEAPDRIFDDFYQVEDPLTRAHDGLGLGLTIARKLVQLHGGRIWAECLEDEPGTRMHVELPVDGSAASAQCHG